MVGVARAARHRDVAWREVSPPDFAERALQLVTVVLEPRRDPEWVVVDGVCAECRGPLHVRRPIDVFLAGEADLAPGSADAAAPSSVAVEPVDVVVWCDCRVAHEGAPEGVTGCGRYFALTVDVPGR